MKKFLFIIILIFAFSLLGFAKRIETYYNDNVVISYWGEGEEYTHIRVYISEKWREDFGDDYQVYLVYKYPGVTFIADENGNCIFPEGTNVIATKWHVFYYNDNEKAGYKVFEMNSEKGLIPLYSAEDVDVLKNVVFFCCPYNMDFNGNMKDYFTVVIAKKNASYNDVLNVLKEEGRSLCQ